VTTADTARARLLEVASELFTRKGYEETSVREITSLARVNLGAITYHFGSKEALYHAAVEEVTAPLAEAVAAAAERPGSAVDRVEAIVRAVLGYVVEHPGTPRMLLRELSSDRPIAPPMARAMKRNIGTLVAAIAAGQLEGSIRPGDAALLALSVVSQPFFITVAGPLVRDAFAIDGNDPAVHQRIVDHIVWGVRRFIAKQPEAPL
jgi:AcrR family transcriptional regulator